MNGLSITLNNNTKGIEVGQYFWCRYTAAANSVGTFSDFATKSDDEVLTAQLPLEGSTTPDGYFKFICVGVDIRGRKILIADRNIQKGLTWSALNIAGIAVTGLSFKLNGDNTLIRLPSGGSTTDTSWSEWDNYIVKNTLNNTINAGDDSIWNWSMGGMFSWTGSQGDPTSSTYSAYRISRGNTSSVENVVRRSATASSGSGFRPLMILDSQVRFSIGTDLMDITVERGVGVDLSVQVNSNGITEPWNLRLRLGDYVFHTSTKYQGDSEVTFNIPTRLFTDSLPQAIFIEVISNGAVKASRRITAALVNKNPSVQASLDGYVLEVGIEDLDGDYINYTIHLNGSLIESKDVLGAASFKRYLRSTDIDIGSQNTIEVIATDHLGDSSNKVITFLGKYHGLMFADLNDRYYSTDLGEVLRRLSLDAIKAGESSNIYGLKLVNTLTYPITDISLIVDYYDRATNTDLSIDTNSDESTFTPQDRLDFSSVINTDESVFFYVRLDSYPGAVGKGKFRIRATARRSS